MPNLPNRLKESPSQTAGPYVHIGCNPNDAGLANGYPTDLGASLVNDHTLGEHISISGYIYDGASAPLCDAMIEIWQADSAGIYPAIREHRGQADENFTGWGRRACDRETGEFCFETILPGAVQSGANNVQAPHITIWIAARGINIGLHTRLYFPEFEAANAADPVLNSIKPAARASTLFAEKTANHDYKFNIYLQGENETVFFDM